MKKGILAVMLAAICTILFYGIRYIHSPVKTQTAELTVYEQKVQTDAYFVREEKVYTSKTTGTVYNHYSDGNRVKNNSLISTIYEGEINEEILQELSSIDKKISASMSNQVSTVTDAGDSTSLESKIDYYRSKIILATMEDNALRLKEYKNAINNLRTGENSTPQDTIDSLKMEKQKTEEKIGLSKTDIFSDMSGMFTTVLDGLETVLTPEKVKEFSVNDFNNIKINQSQTTPKTVSAGDNVCKIVNNHEWYVVALVPSEDLNNHKEGETVKMRFDSMPGEESDGKISYISEEQDGKRVVLIQSSIYLEGAYSFRTSKMDLIFKSYSGYKIPIQAIRVEGEQKGVIGEKNNQQKFYPCKIVYTDDKNGFVIINEVDETKPVLNNIDKFIIGER